MRISPFMEVPPTYRMTSVVQAPSTADLFMSSSTAAPRSGSHKKYLVSCLICGSFSCLLGAMFLGIYFLIRSYTFNGYFETVPTYVPAILLIMAGLFVMCFARRKYRYSFIIYCSGVTSATSALTCAAVTVTTKVLHMSRLQDLNLNCEYKITTRICRCYSDFQNGPDEGRKLLFDATTDCRVAQGDLYSCLQAIFGLSIAGVLVAVFSCMLSYLLYNHERKKTYWEQLDMRCRLLHASHFSGQSAITLPTSIITNGSQMNTTSCIGCCEQCHITQETINANSISDYPYAPIQFPWENYTSASCDSSKFLTISGNNNINNNTNNNHHNQPYHNHHHSHYPHHHHHYHYQNHFRNILNPNFCLQNQTTPTTTESNEIASATTEYTAASTITSLGNNNNISNSMTGVGIVDGTNYNNNNNNLNSIQTRNLIVTSETNCNDNENSNSSNNNNTNNNNDINSSSNSNSRGWRWPRMLWQRNFDFNLFQQALLSRPGVFNPALDFYSWPNFLSITPPNTITSQYSSPNFINGYPIGMWGPPPPPYSDLNSLNWRNGSEGCNNNNSNNNNINNTNNNNNNINNINNNNDNSNSNNYNYNDNHQNQINNFRTSQLDYIDLQPPEYTVEPLSIIPPAMNCHHNESNNNHNSIAGEMSQVTKK